MTKNLTILAIDSTGHFSSAGIFDKIGKTLPKLIEKSYAHIKADREKELVKIKKLKNTIKKEQKEFNQIHKRHPFVKTIIASRA